MVARTPLVGTVQGPYSHALVESSRGENVIELILSGLRGLPRCEISRTFLVSFGKPGGVGSARMPLGYRGPMNSSPSAFIRSKTVRSRAGSASRLSSVAP